MTILNSIIMYTYTLLIFLGIDAVWLLVISKNFYKENIGHLMTDNPNLLAALIFYLFFVVGIIFFVIFPAVKDENIWKAVLNGAIFGFMTYATYDLTNYATLTDWPLKVVIIDILWGMFIAITTGVISYLITIKFLNI
jgi:uncharacterized membrane protein